MKFPAPILFGSMLLSTAFVLASACSSDPSPTPSGHADAAPEASVSDANTDANPLAERGSEVVQVHGCGSCHSSSAGLLAGNNNGVDGTVNGAATKIYPANLTPDPDTGLGTWTDAQIARAVRAGVDDECKTLCSGMPHFNLSDDDMAALIAYLRALPAVSNEVTNQGCPGVDGGAGVVVDAGDCP